MKMFFLSYETFSFTFLYLVNNIDNITHGQHTIVNNGVMYKVDIKRCDKTPLTVRTILSIWQAIKFVP